MKKYYVSIETAKVLKEKGYIHQPLNRDEWYSEPPYANPDRSEILYPKAQLHEVQQWLREEHGINIYTMRATINYGDAISEDDMLKYFWHIQGPYKQHRVDVGVYCTAYEQALESGINEALKMI